MSQYETGIAGESAAEKYLCGLGMECIARRYRGADGEIDLVMKQGDMIVFVEVKARPGSARGAGLMAVTPAKQRRMSHAALHFLVHRELLDSPVRFDVVEISSRGIIHVPNAFLPPRE